MKTDSKAYLLKIFISTTDKINSSLLYENIVLKAKEKGLAGATVHKGMLGFGASSVIHSSRFWEMSEKLPVIIEIIDDQIKIDTFFDEIKPLLDHMPKGCLVTKEEVQVLLYKSGAK
jgi:PII-like signaling protein